MPWKPVLNTVCRILEPREWADCNIRRSKSVVRGPEILGERIFKARSGNSVY